MANIPSNINEMMQNIYRDSIAYTNRFEVEIFPPSGINTGLSPLLSKSLTLRCNSVSIPGRSLTTQNYRFYGPQRQMPYEPLYSGDLALSYVLSSDLRERVFFENWLDGICNPQNYKFSFYAEYTTTMQIRMLDKTDTVVYTAVVEEVYPKQVGEIMMGYEKDNEMATQDITLAYRKYTPIYSNNSAPLPSPSLSPQPSQPNPNEFSPIPNQYFPPIYANPRDQGPRQWFERDPSTGKIIRRGIDGSVNGVINGRP